jgi:hypothetical protein
MQDDLLIVVRVAGDGGEIVVCDPRLERQGARRQHSRPVHVVLHRVKGGEVEKLAAPEMQAGRPVAKLGEVKEREKCNRMISDADLPLIAKSRSYAL